MVEQTLQRHPADRTVLVVPQAVVVHGEQVPGQGVVRDLHLHVVIDAGGDRGGRGGREGGRYAS